MWADAPYWLTPLAWALCGVGLLLIVLAMRPPVTVAIAAAAVALISVSVGGKLFIDGRSRAKQVQAFSDCAEKHRDGRNMQECAALLVGPGTTKMGFIGNEAYAN